MVAMNVVYAATAWPMGRVADRLPRLPILALSLLLLALAAVLLAQGGNGGWGNLRFKSSTNRAPARAN